jgi:hypothetical protein
MSHIAGREMMRMSVLSFCESIICDNATLRQLHSDVRISRSDAP